MAEHYVVRLCILRNFFLLLNLCYAHATLGFFPLVEFFQTKNQAGVP